MPDPVERTFTEKEAYALVADNVQRETAAAAATIEALNSEKAALQTQVDTLEAAKEAEKARADAAEKALEDHKALIETEKAQEGRKASRVAKVREVAKHLKDEFFTPERAQRWAAMEDQAFEAYVAELADISAGVPTEKANENQPPRETAMDGSTVTGTGKTPLLSQLLRGPAAAQKTEV